MFRKFSSSMAKWVLVLICIGSFSLMRWAARTDSAIDDELAHIPAGYGYVSQLSYDLNPEHPPLEKALAMLPVLFLHPNFSTTSTAWTTEVNGEWDMGTQFLYQSGNNANAIIQTARVMPILLTILTILLVYFLARRVLRQAGNNIGGEMANARSGIAADWWALVPTFMFAFDPTILAHGHYVTTDVGAAFGVLLSLFFFLRFIDTPTTKNLWLAGIAFGVAQLTKFSLPLVTVLFIFLSLILWLRELARIPVHSGDLKTPRRPNALGFWRILRNLILIIGIGYVVIVYPVYFLFTVHYPMAKQVSDTTEILTSFASGPTPAGQLCKGMRCLADADIWMAGNPVTRPYGEYLLGLLMSLQRSDGGNVIYFLGHVVDTGGWKYFPVLFLLKEPIPTLIIIFLALILTIWWIIKKALRNRTWQNNWHAVLHYFENHFPEFSMASFIILYWGYSMHSPLNIGIRHILPTLPLMYILATVVWSKWIMSMQRITLSDDLKTPRSLKGLFFALVKYILLMLLLAWLLLETLFAAPYFLSYFNEFGGGVWSGYHYVTDSNYDWGQDLLRLQTFVNAHPEINKIAVDYFGGGDPSYYLGAKEVNWSPSKGNPADPTPGSGQAPVYWLAVSVNQLELAIQPLAPGVTRNASDTYAWLTALRPPASSSNEWIAPGMGNVPAPDYRIGTSIFVYKL